MIGIGMGVMGVMGALIIITAVTGLTASPEFLNNEEQLELIALIVLLPIGILLFVMQLDIFAKRWHDLGRSGWWTLLTFIPFIGSIIAFALFIYLGVAQGQAEDNQYGPG